VIATGPSLRERCDEIRSRMPLSSVAASSLKLRRAGREWQACCPFHPDRKPSFTIYADDRRFMCFGCGAEGDVLDFVMRLHNVRLIDALELLGSRQLPEAVAPRPLPEREHDRSGEAAALWNAAVPAQGSIAEAYLRSRGITVELPDSVRFAHLPLGQHVPMPALVAAVSTLDGQVAGIQRTFLSADPIGKAQLRGGKAKFSLGRVRGGAIRLGPVSRSMLVTEGLEDGLSLLQTLGRPVWVAAGAGMLPAMRLPELVEAVIIGADDDHAGEAAAQKAAIAFAEQGKRVRIMRPRRGCKDFNDQLLERSS
jgi:DNA primase